MSWIDQDPDERPTMQEVVEQLRVMANIPAEDEDTLETL